MAQPVFFLGLTFAISLIAFIGIATIPGAQTPENARGLPFWLVAVWGPSLAAFAMAWSSGALSDLASRAVLVSGVPVIVWCLAVSPLFVLGILAAIRGDMQGTDLLTFGLIAKLLAFNLVLGPLGEEFGWRGYLQPVISSRFGWLLASLIVGGIWFLWHVPLWFIPSPQAEIPMPIFAAHVMAYAVILGAMVHLGGASLMPVIVFHLLVNATAAIALIVGLAGAADYYRLSLPLYALMAAGLAIWIWLQEGGISTRSM